MIIQFVLSIQMDHLLKNVKSVKIDDFLFDDNFSDKNQAKKQCHG